MASMKALKGNPFEYNVMYSLLRGVYRVYRPDVNEKSVDLYASKDLTRYIIECKNYSSMSIKKMFKLFRKIPVMAGCERVLVVKLRKSGVYVVYENKEGKCFITEFETYFGTEYKERPKGVNVKNIMNQVLEDLWK